MRSPRPIEASKCLTTFSPRGDVASPLWNTYPVCLAQYDDARRACRGYDMSVVLLGYTDSDYSLQLIGRHAVEERIARGRVHASRAPARGNAPSGVRGTHAIALEHSAVCMITPRRRGRASSQIHGRRPGASTGARARRALSTTQYVWSMHGVIDHGPSRPRSITTALDTNHVNGRAPRGEAQQARPHPQDAPVSRGHDSSREGARAIDAGDETIVTGFVVIDS